MAAGAVTTRTTRGGSDGGRRRVRERNARREPLPWANSTLLSGDVPAAVERLEADLDGDLLILGSGVFVRWLIARGLVDRLIMLIHPLVLGSGRRLFEEGLPATRFGLTETRTSATGVVIATYERG